MDKPDTLTIELCGKEYKLDLRSGAWRRASELGIDLNFLSMGDMGFGTLAKVGYIATLRNHPGLSQDEWDDVVDDADKFSEIVAFVVPCINRMSSRMESAFGVSGNAGKERPKKKAAPNRDRSSTSQK